MLPTDYRGFSSYYLHNVHLMYTLDSKSYLYIMTCYVEFRITGHFLCDFNCEFVLFCLV